MIEPLASVTGAGGTVLVGPETGDDAGVYLQDGTALIGTVDFITPVCDDARRFGRVAAANSVSDIYAMGGTPIFALNLCSFPAKVPLDILAQILEGGADVLRETGAALLGGHTVKDAELKFGLAVIGCGDPDRLLKNTDARVGDKLILTKPLGTGVLINAYKMDKLDEDGLEPAMVEMERLNATASELALSHGVQAATDVTGFGLTGHALAMARASNVGVHLLFDSLPVHERFYDLIAQGVSTGSTKDNRSNVADVLEIRADLTAAEQELLFDPQTSGGLLIAVAAESAPRLLEALVASGHSAAEVGEILDGPPRLEVD
jgi:selenide,water dikinase